MLQWKSITVTDKIELVATFENESICWEYIEEISRDR